MTGTLRLEWFRDPEGYEIVEIEKGSSPAARSIAAGERHCSVVKPRSGREEPYVLEGAGNRIFIELANAEKTPEAVLAFTKRHGLLWTPPGASDRGSYAQPLEEFYDAISGLRTAAELAGSNGLQEIVPRLSKRGVRLHMRLVQPAGETAPRLILDPTSLLSFLHAEFLQRLDGGIEIRNCPRCGKVMAAGRAGQQPRYCSDSCRVSAHRRMKRLEFSGVDLGSASSRKGPIRHARRSAR